MPLSQIFILYLIFRLKHVLCDFFLQTSWMALEKGKPFKDGGAKALFSHAGIHGLFTFIIMIGFAPSLWWLGPVDFVVHSIIDRIKVKFTDKMGWTYKNDKYWWAFGLDQEAHHITHALFIVAIIMWA